MANICLINTHFPPYVSGGAENYVLHVAKGLQGEGHKITVIATKPYDGISSLKPEKSDWEGLDVYYFYPANVSHKSEGTGSNIFSKAVWHQIDTINLHSKKVAGDLLEDIEPDIVHTHNLMGISTLIAKAIQRTSAKHIHTLHDYGLICPKSNLLRERTAPEGGVAVCENPPAPCRGYKAMKRAVFGTPDMVTAPSRHIIDVHKGQGYFKETPCRRLQLGVESTVTDVPQSEEDTSILFVGKHLKAKGLDTVYEAAAELPKVTFHICGSGPHDYRAKEEAEKRENILYHGFVEEDRLEELRQKASAGILPSIWMENSPLTIYESYASGLPIIGSDIGGIPELVNEGKTGWLFAPGDSTDLVRKIGTVKDNNTQEIRQNVIDWAREHTIDTHVQNLISDIYKVE
jgi:glycosyltransferase involved in cell wall biosynthesis